MKKLTACVLMLLATACIPEPPPVSPNPAMKPKASNGVTKAEAQVRVGSDGLTVEQRNVRDRLTVDNTPGAIKHLYIISSASGQCLLYSTVRGKVTSSGKRLSPSRVVVTQGYGYGTGNGYGEDRAGFPGYSFSGKTTDEVLGDDGTYGSSDPYVYWWDVRGVYHQQYLNGDFILHVSDQPLAIKSVVLNLELANAQP